MMIIVMALLNQERTTKQLGLSVIPIQQVKSLARCSKEPQNNKHKRRQKNTKENRTTKTN